MIILWVMVGLFTLELTVGLIITLCIKRWGVYG